MMFEKYIAKRIVKDIPANAMNRDGTRVLLPGDLVDALNCTYYSSDNGKRYVVRSSKGNSLRSYGLPSGLNKAVGAFTYHRANSIIYFIWNSNNDDRVIEWNPQANSFTVLLAGDLNMGSEDIVVQGGIIDDFLIWNDRVNRVRKINITRAKSGLYQAPFKEWQISLAARPPIDAPTFVFQTDTGFPFNYISRTGYQFSYQFVYLDGEESVFSPLSTFAYPGEIYDPTEQTNNVVQVSIDIPTEILSLLRTVNVAFREGNTGNYFVFKQITTGFAASMTVRFDGTEIALPISPTMQTRLYDAIPPRVDAMGIISNRVFVSLNNLGFDIPANINLDVTLGAETRVVGKRYLKMGGSYAVGVVFGDDFGQTTFVKSRKTVTVPYNYGNSTQEIIDTQKSFINWALSGTMPAGATWFQIVLSPNGFQQIYAQCKAIAHLYYSEKPEGAEEGLVYDTYYIWRNKRWTKPENALTSGSRSRPNYKYVYLQVPLNLPIVPDNTYFIRVLTPSFQTKIIPIIAVEEDWLVIDLQYFGDPPTNRDSPAAGTIIDWSRYLELHIEIFKPGNNPQQTFFETGKVYKIVNGVPQTTAGRLDGDTFDIVSVGTKNRYQYTPMLIRGTGGYKIPQLDNTLYSPYIRGVESPTGFFSTIFIETDTVGLAQVRRSSRSIVNPVLTTTVQGASQASRLFTLDYSRIASDFGRVHTFDDNERLRNNDVSVGFSDPIISNTQIFGMNSFDPSNRKDMPRERTAIKHLVAANDVLVSLHDRNTSTLYIGEGFIRQGDDFILAKTDGVIGDDRSLEFSYGCINPESVQEIYGNLYFWDAFRGAVVRYTRAGNFPISRYGNEYYFLAKARAYDSVKSTIKVFSGFDPVKNEYLITFPAVPALGIVAETWAFDIIEEVWTTRYSFIPEMYAALNNALFSFKNGQVWAHDTNALHNNFYGQQFLRYFRFACNPALGKNKRLLNIHIREQQAQTPTSEFNVVEIESSTGQISYIPAYEFELDEGKYCAPVLRDITTPGLEPGQLALRSGDEIVGDFFLVNVITDRTDEAPCSHVNVVFKTEEFSI